jgi:omega-6 fatty acid desaturase (delta-12 desaturase)
VALYAKASSPRAAWTLGSTVGANAAAMLLLGRLLAPSVDGVKSGSAPAPGSALATGLLVLLLALLRLRLFMIFHDCTHRAFWPNSVHSKWGSKCWPMSSLNRVTGLALGSVLYTPFSAWAEGHRFHHRTVNNVDFPQDRGQTSAPWTTSEFDAAGWLHGRRRWRGRLWYLLWFGPATFFTVVPSLTLVVAQRFTGSLAENAGCVAWLALVAALGGAPGLRAEALIVCIMAGFGYALFHLQHTFDGSYKATDDDWDWFANALRGCSLAEVPECLKPFTLGIEYHHVHHMHTGVPCYALRACHEDGVAAGLFGGVHRVHAANAVSSLLLSIFDDSGSGTDRAGTDRAGADRAARVRAGAYVDVYGHALRKWIDELSEALRAGRASSAGAAARRRAPGERAAELIRSAPPRKK